MIKIKQTNMDGLDVRTEGGYKVTEQDVTAIRILSSADKMVAYCLSCLKILRLNRNTVVSVVFAK